MKIAAGILPYCPTTKRFLISKRGPNISEPNKWVCFGGKADEGERPEETAEREFREESGYKGQVKIINKPYTNYNKDDGFVFITFIGYVPNEFKPTTIGKKTVDGDVEISDAKWVSVKILKELIDNEILHFGFNKFLKKLFKLQENNMKYIIESLDKDFPLEEDGLVGNTTSAIEPLRTPHAFKRKKTDEEKYEERIEEIYQKLIKEISYKDFKTSEGQNTRQKINTNINKINGMLREVEQMINHASKLKLESGSDQTVFWKGTFDKFQKIDQRLNRLSNKIREMNT